jgi:HlyD family secretion protein
MKQTKKKVQVVPLLIIAVLAIAAFVLVYTTQTKKVQKFSVVKVEKGTVTQTIRLTGTLMPEKEVEIKSRLSGILETIFVEVGQKVKKGDAIARIRLIADPQSVEQAGKNLKMAEIQFSTEAEMFKRNKELFESAVISKGEFEEAERQYLVKKAELESARHQLEIVQKGFKTGNKDISDLVLATSDGTILNLPLKEGASVTERNNYNDGSTIALIADLDHFNFNTQVSESEVVRLSKGNCFNLVLNALKEVTLRAEWSLIQPKGEVTDGIVKFSVQARILNAGSSNHLKPGFTASALIELSRDSNVVVIDERHIHFRNDSTFINVVGVNGLPVERHIKTGVSDGVRIAVVEGLAEGESVQVQSSQHKAEGG